MSSGGGFVFLVVGMSIAGGLAGVMAEFVYWLYRLGRKGKGVR